jgi:hypothetical protein
MSAPALDQGSCLAGSFSTDARGFTRPWDAPGVTNADDGCDAGAYESRDGDADGVEDWVDNCPFVANPTQIDRDLGLGVAPAAIWRLDEGLGSSVADGIGSHVGTLSGNPQWVPGISGSALQFDGSGDEVVFADAADLNFDTNDDFTVAAWVNLPVAQVNTASTTNTIVGKEQFGVFPWTIRVYNQNSGSAGRLRVVRSDGSNFPGVDSSVAVNDASWHHVAFVRDAGILKLYLDGALDGSAADNTVNTTTNAVEVRIGRRAGGSLDLTGSVDEVLVRPGALSAAQVLALYQKRSLAGDGIGAACDCDDADPTNTSAGCLVIFADGFESQ